MSINTITSNPTILQELKLASSDLQIEWVPITPMNNWTAGAFVGKLGNIAFMKGTMSKLSASGQAEQMGTIPSGYTSATPRAMAGSYNDGSGNVFIAGINISGQNNLSILNALTQGQTFSIYFDGISYALN
jgi:hypothetical protein